MMHVCSFPPIATADARILILGTMPGKESLRQQQYYAHPKNAFWRIIGEILGFDAGKPYEHRTASLSASGIALWDVLQSCTRESSLDSDIDRGTVVPNDFAAFFASHPHIRRICFNGATAEDLFRRYVRPLLAQHAHMEYVRLPSTSPAHAAISYAEKLRAWQAIIRGV